MKKFYLILLLILLLPLTLQAQTTPPQVAFVNPSGQLIVAGADGRDRWIVTNPGERLHPTLGYTWSPDGSTLFFAVEAGETVSLRFGDVTSQQVTEAARVLEPVSGGSWQADNTVPVVSAEQDGFYNASGLVETGTPGLLDGETILTLLSPYVTDQPHLQYPSSLSPDGEAIFGLLPDSTYGILSAPDVVFPLRVQNRPNVRKSGIWSADIDTPFVAYHGTAPDGASVLGAASPMHSTAVELRREVSVPMLPILWIPGSAGLVYRDDSGQIRAASLSCLVESCEGDNPLERGQLILPAAAEDIQAAGDYLYYRVNGGIYAQPIDCIPENTCDTTAVQLAVQAAPRTILHVVDTTLVYTAYRNDPADPTDREIRLLDTSCLPNGCGQPLSLVGGAIAGMLSPDAQYLIMDVIGEGRHVLRLADMNRVYLSETGGAGSEADLLHTRWNGHSDAVNR